jgi:hypothetical protein
MPPRATDGVLGWQGMDPKSRLGWCRIQVRSRLAADAKAVWAHARTLRGVNRELAPIRMSGPQDIALDEVPLGRPLLRSFVTAFGVVPLDLHELTLVEVTPDRGFHERSRSLWEAHWIHRRTIEPADRGCIVVDDVTFSPRLFKAFFRSVIARAFASRHRWLRRLFGGDDVAPQVEYPPPEGATIDAP